MMFVREFDAFLDFYLFDGAWQLFVVVILTFITVFVWGRISKIYGSIKHYSLQPSFGMFIAGFVTVVVFSRLMGRGSFWQSLMGQEYVRVVKNVVEEGIETFGYALIFMAALELVLACCRRTRWMLGSQPN
ncbi:hypothetical protein [Marinomonas algarum]|uniref:Uncharacterized protein n=1 Tax=Marinomonas algarum TaxID=2883105 RepID=A0A9X1IM76_9GAMM|nr:hypothetical protein [Marinomonas algarum]MCB5160866.1 hypothetical protein [Marinomonas algarum]